MSSSDDGPSGTDRPGGTHRLDADDRPSTEDLLTPPAIDPSRLVRVTPSWQAILVGALLAIMLGIVAGVTAYIAQNRANEHTDRRLAELERDRAERRAAADAANARRDQQIAETQRIVCVVMNRIEPRDAEVQRIRVQFRCDAQPDPAATPSGR